jgi:putative salt-induced outer membrane protein
MLPKKNANQSKRRNLLTVIFTTLVLFLPTGLFAAETPSGPWQGNVELGYLMSTGNTETRSLNAKMGVAYETEKWRHSLGYETVYSHEKEEGTTAQRFLVSGRTNYNIDPRNGVYALTLYENDRFSAYDYQVTASAGYNRKIILTEKTEWSAEIGPGYRYSRFKDDTISSEEEAIVHLGTDFLYRFTDTIAFVEELTADAGEDNTIIRSTSSLRVMLRDQLSLRLSYHVRHVTDVPQDVEKTDTETFVSLAYDF